MRKGAELEQVDHQHANAGAEQCFDKVADQAGHVERQDKAQRNGKQYCHDPPFVGKNSVVELHGQL